MSLILEALRKREREKQVPERGFLVMAPAPWAAPRGRGVAVIVLAGVVAFGLGVAFMAWRAPVAHPPAVAPPAPPVAPPARMTPGTLLPAPASTLRTTSLAPPVPRAEPGPAQPAMPTAEPAPAAETPSIVPPSPAAEPRFVLQAISVRDGRPVALISDRLMREGDEWQGARLVRIGETEVELEIAGQRVTLRF
jgi:hypothetical protein